MSDIVCKRNDHYTKNNEKITDVGNVIPNITKQVKIFYDKALKINIVENRPFSCEDYPNLSKENYRQYILKLRLVIEKVRNSRPAFYKIKGVYLPGDSHKITISPMGDATDLIETLNHEYTITSKQEHSNSCKQCIFNVHAKCSKIL